MATRAYAVPGAATLAEIKEFASFGSATQRYIRRSLDVGLLRGDAIETWSRGADESDCIKAQARLYRGLDEIRGLVPEGSDLSAIEDLLAPLVRISAFDLGQGRLECFTAYRFLYERLISSAIRPWLPSAYCAAASLPHLPPPMRKNLLQSISEAAATAPSWSAAAPVFYPEWVEKIDDRRAAH